MKVIISGGSGLIGTALVNQLLTHGHQVMIISRFPERVRLDVKSIPWTKEAIQEEIEVADAVVNLAGASIAGAGYIPSRWTKKRKAEILNSRLFAGSMIVDAIQQATHKPEVLIQASAIGYYGNKGAEAVDENGAPGTDFLADVSQAWEESTSLAESLNVRRVIIRIGLVLSRQGGLLPLLSLPFRFFAGGRIGSGSQYMSWIHIKDVVNAIHYLIENPDTQGIYNLTAPEPVTFQEFANQFGEVLKRPAWLPLPAFLFKAILGEAATLALDGREVLPGRLLKTGFTFQFTNLPNALVDLFR
jgi:uncharacterized protein (TIGR01777 family)